MWDLLKVRRMGIARFGRFQARKQGKEDREVEVRAKEAELLLNPKNFDGATYCRIRVCIFLA